MKRKGWTKRFFRGGNSKGQLLNNENDDYNDNDDKKNDEKKTINITTNVGASGDGDDDERDEMDNDYDTDGVSSDILQIKMEIELADKCFMRNDYEKAIELYTKAITELKENENMQNDLESKQTVGDIHVKLSSILQGQGELSYSLRYLTKARDIYKECANMMIQNQHQKSQSLDDSQCYNCASSGRTLRSAKGGESILEHSSNKNNNNEHKIDNVGVAKSATESKSMLTDQVLALKIVEIITGIANIYVDKGDIDDATEHYQDAVKMSRYYFESDEKVADTLMNYGNFLSICVEDHIGAVDILKDALKMQLKFSDGAMNPNSAATLNSMGKAYMRRSNAFNTQEGIKDAQRAEACFVRAMQLYRLSMLRNGNEKVIDTIHNLNEARKRQKTNKGILRNVRFDHTAIEKDADTDNENVSKILRNIDATDSILSESDESTWNGSVDDDDSHSLSYPRYTNYSDLSDDMKSWYSYLGLEYVFNCGANEESIQVENTNGVLAVVEEESSVVQSSE